MSKRLLLVGTDDNLQAVSQVALEGEHTWSLETCDAPGPAFELIAQNPPDAVLYDVHLDKYPFCEFARQVHSKQGDASIAIIIAGDDVNEGELGELENVWSFPSPIIPEVLITILNKSSDKTKDKRYGEEVDGAIGSVFTGAKPPRKQYEPIEGVEVQTLYGEDEDGIALDDAAKEPQPLDVVEVDDSSEFIGVNDDIDLESVEIIAEEQPAEEYELEILELVDGDMEGLEMVEILELSDDDDELEFVEAEPLDAEVIDDELESVDVVEAAQKALEPEEVTPSAEDEESVEADDLADEEAESEPADVTGMKVDETHLPDAAAEDDGGTLEELYSLDEVASEDTGEGDGISFDDVEAEESIEEEEEQLQAEDGQESAAANMDDAFSFDDVEAEESIVEEQLQTEDGQESAAADMDDAFSFDEVEADTGVQPEQTAVAAEEVFSFDEVESTIGVDAVPAPAVAEETFCFDEAEGLAGATAAAADPVRAATLALEGLVSQELSSEKLDAIIRETVERVVWEVVPPLAEKLISEAIEKLKDPQ